LAGMSLAVDALRGGRIDLALAGSVSLLLNDGAHELFASRQLLSQDGRFHIYDRQANGEVLGEGGGVVVLKRRQDAIRDGDRIYCVIKGIAVNNDGRTLGPGSPGLETQKQVMREALAQSGKTVSDIDYIEVNGGGTPVADAVEIKALAEVYCLDKTRLPGCHLGCVKPNIGHLLLSSGLAAFIRCALSLYYQQIPPFLSAHNPCGYYDFSQSRVLFNRTAIDWRDSPDKRRTAALNSFPDGGTNVHVITEAFLPGPHYCRRRFPLSDPPTTPRIFPLFHAPQAAAPPVGAWGDIVEATREE
ncbi:MAG: beta-ketoacyl synthase N-terminal-like domain-containing protein, partial [Enterobacter roggenkampii]